MRGSDTEVDGGNSSDRIYVSTASEALTYQAGEDAAFHMKDGQPGIFDLWGPASWTLEEIEQVDDALRLMHELSDNDALIQQANGRYMTFVRCGDWNVANSAIGWNDGAGTIRLWEPAFDDMLGVHVVHEMGHNWDREENPDWSDFMALSGWTQTPHPNDPDWAVTADYTEIWWYQVDSEWLRDYSFDHPIEDWATCMEAYFYGRDLSGILTSTPDLDHSWMQNNMPDKFQFVHDFLTSF